MIVLILFLSFLKALQSNSWESLSDFLPLTRLSHPHHSSLSAEVAFHHDRMVKITNAGMQCQVRGIQKHYQHQDAPAQSQSGKAQGAVWQVWAQLMAVVCDGWEKCHNGEGSGVVTAPVLPVTAGSTLSAGTHQLEQRRPGKMGYS